MHILIVKVISACMISWFSFEVHHPMFNLRLYDCCYYLLLHNTSIKYQVLKMMAVTLAHLTKCHLSNSHYFCIDFHLCTGNIFLTFQSSRLKPLNKNVAWRGFENYLFVFFLVRISIWPSGAVICYGWLNFQKSSFLTLHI